MPIVITPAVFGAAAKASTGRCIPGWGLRRRGWPSVCWLSRRYLPGPIDLVEAVRDVVELYEPVAEEAGVSLETAVQGNFIIGGNRELIGQALSNIVDNAIKYSTDATEKPRVVVTLERADHQIRLSVADNGHGIPDDADRARATERFVRLEKSRSQPGSGLGLSLAKAIMRFHNGQLDLLPGNPGLSVVMSFPDRGDH